jgi:hypothetical protein
LKEIENLLELFGEESTSKDDDVDDEKVSSQSKKIAEPLPMDSQLYMNNNKQVEQQYYTSPVPTNPTAYPYHNPSSYYKNQDMYYQQPQQYQPNYYGQQYYTGQQNYYQLNYQLAQSFPQQPQPQHQFYTPNINNNFIYNGQNPAMYQQQPKPYNQYQQYPATYSYPPAVSPALVPNIPAVPPVPIYQDGTSPPNSSMTYATLSTITATPTALPNN